MTGSIKNSIHHCSGFSSATRFEVVFENINNNENLNTSITKITVQLFVRNITRLRLCVLSILVICPLLIDLPSRYRRNAYGNYEIQFFYILFEIYLYICMCVCARVCVLLIIAAGQVNEKLQNAY